MSYKLVDLCFHIPNLTTSEQAVLQAICKHADNKTHDCYPSRQVIAGFARLEVRQVQRIIPILVDKGLITRESGKGRKPSSYTVRLDRILLSISSEDTMTPLQEEGEPEDDIRSSDTVTPQSEPIAGTLAPSLGRHKDSSEETLTPSCGDIDASLNKKNLSVIGHVIGQEQSVSLALTPDAIPAERVIVYGDRYSQAPPPKPAPEKPAKSDKSITDDEVRNIRLAYPKKVALEAACKAIRAQHALLVSGKVERAADGIKLPKMTPLEATAFLLQRATLYAASGEVAELLRDGGQFIPNPATWFNGKNYTEDPTTWSRSNSHRQNNSSIQPPRRSLDEKVEEQRRAIL